MELSERFGERFKNWLRWCADYAGEPHGSCGSLEGGYRSPQVWDVVEPNMWKLNPVNIPDAELVNRAYVELGDYDRRVIKYVYFRRHWRPSWMAQKLGCHYTQIYGKLHEAKVRMMVLVDETGGRAYFPVKSVTGNRSRPLVEG